MEAQIGSKFLHLLVDCGSFYGTRQPLSPPSAHALLGLSPTSANTAGQRRVLAAQGSQGPEGGWGQTLGSHVDSELLVAGRPPSAGSTRWQ